LVLASFLDVAETIGYPLVFLLIAVETIGIPVPGETALITASIVASRGHLDIEVVIALAAAAAIIGDNVGYWLGRKGGRALLQRAPIIRNHFERVLPPAERFFERHGPKTVFIGRFIAVLRVTAAWLAGISRMPWWRFLLWNAAGGIVWAALVGVVAYKLGEAVAGAIGRYGLYGVVGIAVLAIIGFVGFKLWQRRVIEDT
jgi:membrane protein DedA with SNARE-associated domain